jgi:GNAT superfamily N-acetyltransferase
MNAPSPLLEIVSFERAPQALLSDVAMRAWAADYTDKAVYRFDAAHLRWLLSSGRGFAVIGRDPHGTPVACEVAVARTVRWGDRTLQVYVVTLLSVVPEARGQGWARRVLDAVTEEALDVRGADGIVSMYDAGQAGEPTVIAHAHRSGLQLCTSPTYTYWGAVRDVAAPARYEPLTGISALAGWPGLRQLVQIRPERVRGLPLRHTTATDALRPPDADLALQLGTELDPMYGEEGGCIRCDTASGSVGVAWHGVRLTRTGLPDATVVMIQLLTAPGVRERHLAHALRSVNAFFLGEHGALAVTWLETGLYRPTTLLRGGFLPTDRRVRYAIRGPADRIADIRAPMQRCFVDML